MPAHAFITYLDWEFNPHPIEPGAHTQLNMLYADYLSHPKALYVNPADLDLDVLDDTPLTAVIAQQIIQCIHPIATATPDIIDISPFINSAALTIDDGTSFRRLTKTSFTRALDYARANTKTTLNFRVSINHIYFDMTQGPLNYLDWKLFSRAPAPRASAVAAPSAIDIANAVASEIPPLDITVLSLAFAALLPAPGPGAAAISTAVGTAVASALASTTAAVPPAGAPATPAAPLAATIYTFSPLSLPADVRDRYQNKKDRGLVIGTTVKTPFASGFFYDLVGTDTLILSDGTLFMIQEPNEKSLTRDPVTCKNTQWYQTFTTHLMSHGFYAHPLWCFRANHGGNWGFTCGTSRNDNLKQRMDIPLQKMNQPIFRLLQKRDMFPPDSRLQSIVQSCYGDGYKALKQILFASHPVFYDQPSTLITTYPKQCTLTLLEYYTIFSDYLQLRSFISDTTTTLKDSNELDIFISNAQHSEFLNRVSRDERRITSLAHKYHGAQLIETLQKYLMASDSPATKTASPATPAAPTSNYRRQPYRPNRDSSGPRTLPAGVPVHQLSMLTHPPPPDLLSTIDTDDSLDTVYQDVSNIAVPPDNQSRALYHTYSACISAIKNTPNFAAQQPCIVCGGSHRFDSCTVLGNTEFLRQHYICYCLTRGTYERG
jgi:hypothetical protein